MPAKPNPALGLVLGIVIAYVDIVGASYAAYRLAVVRQVRLDSVVSHGLQWFALLVVIALVTGLLMAPRRIGAGVMVGAGAFMAVVGAVIQLLPLRQSADLAKLFEVPGSNFLPYLLLDGSVMFMGLILLAAGIGRWAADAKLAKAGPQDYPGQQPQQWGGYPGQQQQPPYPGQQQPYHPGQQPPPYNPGQQQPPQYPGQQR